MLKMNVLIILLYVLERFLELMVSARNKKILEQEQSIELLDRPEAARMKFFHGAWFLCLLIESMVRGELVNSIFLYPVVFVLVLAQVLRWTAIATLGKYWSVDVYRMEHHPVIQDGPYAFVRHPNYLAVMTEFFFLPLLLGSPITLAVGFILNLFLLKRRIKIEEDALNEQSGDYQKKFAHQRRFVPFTHG